MEEKIITKHPLGKKNKPILKQEYDLFRSVILNCLKHAELTHTELVAAVTKKLKKKFSGNISWYVMVVKLDLEARKIINRTRAKPIKYSLK